MDPSRLSMTFSGQNGAGEGMLWRLILHGLNDPALLAPFYSRPEP